LFDKFGDTAADWGVKFGKFTANVIEKVKGLVTWFSNLDGGTQKFIGVLAGLAVSAGPVLMIFGKIMQTFTALAPLVKIAGLALGALTSPIGLVDAGIAVLAAGFVIAYNKSETFRNFIDGLKDKFVSAWQSAMEFKDKVVTAFEGIIAIFKGDHIGAAEMLSSIGLSEETIDNVFLAVAKIQNAFEDVKDKIGIALGAVKEFFIGAFNDIKSWWDSDGTLIFNAMGTTVSKVFEFITFAVDTALKLVVELFKRFAPI